MSLWGHKNPMKTPHKCRCFSSLNASSSPDNSDIRLPFYWLPAESWWEGWAPLTVKHPVFLHHHATMDPQTSRLQHCLPIPHHQFPPLHWIIFISIQINWFFSPSLYSIPLCSNFFAPHYSNVLRRVLYSWSPNFLLPVALITIIIEI